MNILFWVIFFFAEGWGITAMALAGVWMSHYGGFDWTIDHIFNFHPVFMSVAMIFLFGQAILIYRVLRFLPKKLLKLAHASIHVVIIILFSVGLAAVFNFHNWKSIPNLYSLHSWLGIALIASFCLQFIAGVLVLLLPFAPLNIRTATMPFHRLFGMVMFGAAGATAMMGATEKAIFSSSQCWSNRTCIDADLINWFGLSVFLYVASVLFLVATPDYRREPLASD